MIYVNGLGYVDETNYLTNNPDYKVNNVDRVSDTSFQAVLDNSTGKINENGQRVMTLEEIFQEAASTYGVDVNLLKTFAFNESNFRNDVTSSAGAGGMMQLMPVAAKYLGVEDVHDPYQAINGAAKLLGEFSKNYNGDTSVMIAAYAAGIGAVKKYGGVPPYSYLQKYIDKTLKLMNTGLTVPYQTYTIENGKVVDSKYDKASYRQAQIDNQKHLNDIAAGKVQPVNNQASVTPATNNTNNNVSGTTNNANAIASGSSNTQNTNNASTAGSSTENLIDGRFTYEQYMMLMQYYENMLNIISSLGDDNDDDDSLLGNDSLSDLYMLSYKQNGRINSDDVANFSTNYQNTLMTALQNQDANTINNASTVALSEVASAYMNMSSNSINKLLN